MPVVTIITCRGVLGGVMCVLLGPLATAPVAGEKNIRYSLYLPLAHSIW